MIHQITNNILSALLISAIATVHETDGDNRNGSRELSHTPVVSYNNILLLLLRTVHDNNIYNTYSRRANNCSRKYIPWGGVGNEGCT